MRSHRPFIFQSGMLKKNKHDSVDEMGLFSTQWKLYPVLYDDRERNRLFAEDCKAAAAHMSKCYADLAAALNMSIDEVKNRCQKYRDAVTRAVRQYADDLQNGTTDCLTPAAQKLCIFFWLLPYSSNYIPDLMNGKCLDVYVECILRAHLNKMTRQKEDITELKCALEHIRKVIRDSGNPKHIELHVTKLCFCEMASLSQQYSVTFRHNLTPMPVFEDYSPDIQSISPVQVFNVQGLPYSISSWLSRTREPLFDWKVRGLKYFTSDVHDV